MSNKKIITISTILAIALIAGGLIYVGRSKLNESSSQPTPGIVVGSESAPVTVELYSNFLCSHCADFEFNAWPGIRDKYVTSGKVRFIFYIVGSYIEIGKAGFCADQGGKFLEFQEYAFSHQSTLANSVGSEGDKTILDFAEKSGLDVLKFRDCYTGSSALKAADDWLNQASEKGVTATPTFLIGDQKIAKLLTLEEFSDIVDQKLNLK